MVKSEASTRLMKIQVFWYMTTYQLVNSCWHVSEDCCLCLQSLIVKDPWTVKLQATNSLQMLVTLYQLIRHGACHALSTGCHTQCKRSRAKPTAVRMAFLEDKVALTQVCLQGIWFSDVSTIPPMLPAYISPMYYQCYNVLATNSKVNQNILNKNTSSYSPRRPESEYGFISLT